MALDPLPDEILARCCSQYRHATNMTDSIAALTNLVDLDRGIRNETFEDFYTKWVGDPLVLDKWFTLQAMSILPTTLDEVRLLTQCPSFSLSNPNRVRALVGTFCTSNHVRFHEKSGAGYGFLADMIAKLNTINPQIAARLVAPLINWKRYDPERQRLMKNALKRIAAIKNLSRDVYEIVNKSR
jgi:aminopeptidase N